MLFSSCMFYLCSPSSFIALLLLCLYALSYLVFLFVDLSIFIALLLWIYCCDYPFPMCFSTAMPSGFGGVRKPSMRP
jgi:hypothetical protein